MRLVELQTFHSEILRPIQRIYPLELSSTDITENMFSNPAVREKQNEQSLTNESCTEVKNTKSENLIKMPDRLIL